MINGPNTTAATAPQFEITRQGDIWKVALSGDWKSGAGLPSAERFDRELGNAPPRQIELDGSGLKDWNSGLPAFLIQVLDLCQSRGIRCCAEGFPDGVEKILHLAQAVPERFDAKRKTEYQALIPRMGEATISFWKGSVEMVTFMGSIALAILALVRKRARFRFQDLLVVIQEAGPEAIGIVALINFLVGLILAFVGAVQLNYFGAGAYVADLVAIAMVREMACIMTAIIMCGRTGAAFAAQLGTMKVNEEVDALRTLGVRPIEFLVLPRVLALTLMLPPLCLFADLIGIFGGFVASTAMLDLTTTEYLIRTKESITVTSFLLGIFKGGVFGMLVAMAGCLRGLQCGNNAAAVGQAATSAVVTGITAIIAADGVFALLCRALEI